MSWRHTKAGKESSKPSLEFGVHVEGPLTVEEWKTLISDMLDALVEHVEGTYDQDRDE